MANEIDASIPLQAKQVQMPDWMTLAQKHASLQESQLKQQESVLRQDQMRAQTPGIEAQSRQQIAEASQAEIKANAAKFVVDAGKDAANLKADGTLDREKVARAAEQAGFLSEANAIRKDKSATEQAASVAEQERIKTLLAQREPAFLEAVQKASPEFTIVGPDGKPKTDQKALAQHLSKDWPIESQKLYADVLKNNTAEIANSTNETERQAKIVAHQRDVAGVTAQGLPNLKEKSNRQHFINGQAAALEKIDPEAADRVFGPKDETGNRPVKDPAFYLAQALTPEEAQALKSSQAGVAATQAGTAQVMQNVKAFNEGTMTPAERADFLIKKTQSQLDVNLYNKAAKQLDAVVSNGDTTIASKPFNQFLNTIKDAGERSALENVRAKLMAKGIDVSKLTMGDTTLRDAIKNELENSKQLAAAYGEAGKSPGAKTPDAAAPAKSSKDNPVTPTSKAEWKALPKGTWYREPDGTVVQK